MNTNVNHVLSNLTSYVDSSKNKSALIEEMSDACIKSGDDEKTPRLMAISILNIIKKLSFKDSFAYNCNLSEANKYGWQRILSTLIKDKTGLDLLFEIEDGYIRFNSSLCNEEIDEIIKFVSDNFRPRLMT